MKYEMTKEDHDIVTRDMQTNRTLKHLKNMSFYKFSIGDVLVREDRYNDRWVQHKAACGLPYKYVYVFENELGVGYIRRISINGTKFVESPICVLEFDPTNTKFCLDPEYADHLLLASDDQPLDLKSQYAEVKKKREQIHRKNKKLRENITSEAEALAWMRKLKVGDTFWYGHSLNTVNKDAMQVTEVTTTGTHNWENYIAFTWNPSSPGNNVVYNSKIYAHQLTYYSIFLTRPTFLDEVI